MDVLDIFNLGTRPGVWNMQPANLLYPVLSLILLQLQNMTWHSVEEFFDSKFSLLDGRHIKIMKTLIT
jgi:hypothetical protein